jgi:hypothetical protein
MAQPLFIFGVARGGTNLIARALGEHSRVIVALDALLPFFRLWRNLACLKGLPEDARRRFDPAAPFQDYYFHPDSSALLDTLFKAEGALPVTPHERAELREAVVARAALERPDLAVTLANLDGSAIREIFGSIVDIVRRWETHEKKSKVAYTAFKELWTVDFLPALARLLPEARFIVIHRDPRAVVTSLLAMGRKDPTQKAHAVSYMRHWRKQTVLTRAFLKDPAYRACLASVRFEDLCERPEQELARLCDFLGIGLEPAMLNPGGDWAGNSSFGPRQASIDASAVERWRATIVPALLETIDFHCGPEMRMIGYAPDHDAAVLTPGIVETVRAFDADPGKWRSDVWDWQTGLAWECLRHQTTMKNWPEDIARRCFLIPPDVTVR